MESVSAPEVTDFGNSGLGTAFHKCRTVSDRLLGAGLQDW
jgi:hypothetical protein